MCDEQVVRQYWAKRAWRIVPAYYAALAMYGATKRWPLTWCEKDAEAARVCKMFDLGQADSRALWTMPLCISNITSDVRSCAWVWNVPIQMQFYLLFPLLVLALQPQRPGIRGRVAWAAAGAALLATSYRAACVIGFDIQASLPAGAVSHPAEHTPTEVAAAWRFLDWMYGSFMSRTMDFALGVLVYLIASSPGASGSLRSRPGLCTAGAMAAAALFVAVCVDKAEVRPVPGVTDQMVARIGMLVFATGVAIPVATAWAMLYIIVQPDRPSQWLAALLGSRRLKWLAARTYSMFLLHPLVGFAVFQAVPVVAWIGPLEDLRTFAIVAGLAISGGFLAAWALDGLLAKVTGKGQLGMEHVLPRPEAKPVQKGYD